ncbi:hypothetical protein LVD15_24340 [Fulvivirga maritima]|uniref:hypothetical protein n=1 Tax=Fulvivirga maritima TaxID=2904247 RepID=UPI001F31325C|nr:hypothetical protein [Fulvivirga maritima]UII26390.1 hypothetical protein LVD15_24340 [Fulvivirga maritima]
MKISAINEISSNLGVEIIKRRLKDSYETKDTLKFAEFDAKYENWPSWMREQLRSRKINNPNIHYLGRYYQGNFELTSPRFTYWRNVSVYVRYSKSNSLLVIELEHFKLMMIPIIIIWVGSLLITIVDIRSGLGVLIVSSIFLGVKILKARNTLNYFKKYVR